MPIRSAPPAVQLARRPVARPPRIASPATDKVLQNVRSARRLSARGLCRQRAGRALHGAGLRRALCLSGTRGSTVYCRQATAGTGLKPTVRVIADQAEHAERRGASATALLYVAEVHRILRYDDIESTLTERAGTQGGARRFADGPVITAGDTSRSARTASCTCRSVRPATFVTSRTSPSSRA